MKQNIILKLNKNAFRFTVFCVFCLFTSLFNKFLSNKKSCLNNLFTLNIAFFS